MKRLLFCLVLLLTACGKNPEPLPTHSRATPEKESQMLASQIVAGIAAGQSSVINDHMAMDRILQHVTRGNEIPDDIRAAFRTQFQDRMDIGGGIVTAQKPGSSYRVLRNALVDGQRRLLCRQLHAAGQVIYHDLILEDVPRPGGYDTRIIELYTYSLGEPYSDTLRRMYIAMCLNTDNELQKRFTSGPEADYAKYFFTLQTILLFVESGKFPSAYSTHRGLPESLRHQKYMLHQQLKLASYVSPEKEQEAIEEFEAMFPGDVSLDLYRLPRLQAGGRHEELTRLIPRLMTSLGDDPYLRYLLGMAQFKSGEHRQGITTIQEAINAEPDLAPAHGGLFECLVREGQFEPAVDLLVHMRRTFGMTVNDIDHNPLYKELREHPAFARYREATGAL